MSLALGFRLIVALVLEECPTFFREKLHKYEKKTAMNRKWKTSPVKETNHSWHLEWEDRKML